MTSSEPRRRWSLRAKLTALVMVTAAIALAAVDILLPLNLRSSLLSTRDATLTAVVSSVPTGHKFDLQTLFELTFTVHELSFRVRGRVTQVRGPRCIGVEFVDLRPRLKRYLEDLIEELAAGGWTPMWMDDEVEGRVTGRAQLFVIRDSSL